jgi:hypothetical protein
MADKKPNIKPIKEGFERALEKNPKNTAPPPPPPAPKPIKKDKE